MSIRYLLSLAVFALPAAAYAQDAASPTKSAEDITCELTGDCAGVVDADEPQVALRDAPQSRGFALRRRTSAPSPVAPSASYNTPAAKSGSYAQEAGRPGPKLGNGQPERKAFKSAATGKGTSTLMVGFVTGSATLDTAGLSQAKQLLAALKGPKLAGQKLIVAGHTDIVGSREYNLDLSQRRAQTLVDYLARNGVDRTTLTPKGYGFDKPMAGTSARNGINRRVEVSLAN